MSVTINTVFPKSVPQNLNLGSWHWPHGLVLGYVTGHLYVITVVSRWYFSGPTPAHDPSLPPREPEDPLSFKHPFPSDVFNLRDLISGQSAEISTTQEKRVCGDGFLEGMCSTCLLQRT